MLKVFDEVNSLDKKCYEEYGLSEDILMEHASSSMLSFIEDRFKENSKILIVSGAGNNGADGIALARLLKGKYEVVLFCPYGTKSEMSIVQSKRALLVEVEISHSYSLILDKYDLVVDCLFGTGLNKNLDESSIKIIEQLNTLDSYKLSCDIPSGINNIGQISTIAFKADTTITMGALKKSLFTDQSKDFIGDLVVANLGIQRELYEDDTKCYLLEESDLKLPYREKLSTHKGDFGHLAVFIGSKSGAGVISCEAGFSFGCGLVTAISGDKDIPYHIMNSESLPLNTTAIAVGMDLGTSYDKNMLNNNIPKVIDADIFYDDYILELLKQDNIVLTPHPKEFISLLKLTNLANINIEELQNNRFKYLNLFCSSYKNVVLLLKGANTLIGYNDTVYINNLGNSILSFGGSGDVLSGLIGSLLAQGYSCIDATINGSLSHCIASTNYTYSNYSLTPNGLIEEIKQLPKTSIKKF
ncbi:MAG: NAD(P)H-hydrate epimerase [Campylobacterota bacterium]|nr:NAD(P)H-hydrate epimerase [Campylobacterota bacterium]